jgi:hypothetical protein
LPNNKIIREKFSIHYYIEGWQMLDFQSGFGNCNQKCFRERISVLHLIDYDCQTFTIKNIGEASQTLPKA